MLTKANVYKLSGDQLSGDELVTWMFLDLYLVSSIVLYLYMCTGTRTYCVWYSKCGAFDSLLTDN